MKLTAIRPMRYATRRLMAGDEFYAPDRDARVLIAIRKAAHAPAEIAPVPPPLHSDDDLASVRAAYERIVGRRPYHGWDIEILREKIAAASES